MLSTRERRTTYDAKRGGRAVILRVCRAKINPARLEEYRRFEQERCLPMLHKQPGFLGVLFLRQAGDRAASLTIWEDVGVVEALQSSRSYRETTHELAESSLLAGNESVEVLEVEGGDLRPEALARALDRTRRAGS
jgi:heme-degrading monooxygenase HmoA